MLTSMLEKAIEIEGLLRIIRDGNPLPETYKLLIDKAESLAAETAGLSDETVAEAMTEENVHVEQPEADFIMATPEVAPEPPKVDFTAVEAVEEERIALKDMAPDEPETATADNMELDLDLEEEDDIILSFDDMTEPIPAAEEIMSAGAIVEQPVIQEITAVENLQDDATLSINIYNEEKENAIEETRRQNASVEKAAPARQVKLRSIFSLNDRFLYARELFNGNMKMFDSTLDHIEGISDFSIIEDYFYNELEWNPENSNVSAFMDMLRPQFKG
ncbi:MAG: hypothetical protein K2H38_04660 [Muribaculaceae bacterium]|nr:hypothetical protein [Muribaculaceae bacterium]